VLKKRGGLGKGGFGKKERGRKKWRVFGKSLGGGGDGALHTIRGLEEGTEEGQGEEGPPRDWDGERSQKGTAKDARAGEESTEGYFLERKKSKGHIAEQAIIGGEGKGGVKNWMTVGRLGAPKRRNLADLKGECSRALWPEGGDVKVKKGGRLHAKTKIGAG